MFTELMATSKSSSTMAPLLSRWRGEVYIISKILSSAEAEVGVQVGVVGCGLEGRGITGGRQVVWDKNYLL